MLLHNGIRKVDFVLAQRPSDQPNRRYPGFLRARSRSAVTPDGAMGHGRKLAGMDARWTVRY